MVTRLRARVVVALVALTLLATSVVSAPATAAAQELPDATLPSVEIVSPRYRATVASPVEFSGTASDDVGVASVFVAVKRASDGLWLRDDATFGTYQRLPVELSAPGGVSTDWSITLSLPSDLYRVHAIALDAEGNKQNTSRRFTADTHPDTVDPLIEIAFPRADAQRISPVEFSGVASDDEGIADIFIATKRLTDGAWLQIDGTFGPYQRQPLVIERAGQPDVDWGARLDLPDGAYRVHMIARDTSGNKHNATARFTVSTPALTERPRAQESTCAGVRGNGQNLFAHYGALARHVEEYGVITCAAGGSSGSITTFLLESMWANPDLRTCDGARCSNQQENARLALMLKSVIGLVDTGLFQDVSTVQALIAGIQNEDILELLQGPLPEEGVTALLRLLRDLGPLINPELIELLATSPDPVFHATDIIDGLEKGLQFIVDDPAVFLRTSVIDFGAFADLIGVYGSFYAGYGDVDRGAMSSWLTDCSEPSQGLTWGETAALVSTDGRSCGQRFSELFNEYREQFAAGGIPNRANDPVGTYMPAFGVTGVLTGDAIGLWEEARAAWIAAEPIAFVPDFDDVGVGYWGQRPELTRMGNELDRRFTDLGSDQFVALGAASWREVLGSSPAEPGFSPAVPLQSGFVSVGGWADPLRVTPLEALGAEQTITINRLGGVGGFTASVTELLNATPDDLASLYSTVDSSSTFYVSLDNATGVWCTDWDSQGGDPNRLFNDAYNSPLITSDSALLNPSFGYPLVGPDFAIGGCTPGVSVLAALALGR